MGKEPDGLAHAEKAYFLLQLATEAEDRGGEMDRMCGFLGKKRGGRQVQEDGVKADGIPARGGVWGAPG